VINPGCVNVDSCDLSNQIVTGASPDGRHLAFSQQIIDSNVWLMENF
jgi:hypothetical protein